MKTKLLLFLFFIKLSSFAQNVPSYAPVNGLIAYYPFNGNANDNSGNKANGTILNATLTTDRFGNANSAYSFNGVDSFINAVIPNIPQGNSSRTISGWFKTDDVFSDPKKFDACVFNYGALENLQRLSLSMYSKGYLNIITGPDSFSNNNFYADNLNYADNQWYFFTLTYDGNNVSIYVNGQFVNKQGIKLNTTNNIFRIGQRLPDNKNEAFKGKIDDIGIWDRILTSEEILAMYTPGEQPAYTLIPDKNFEQNLINLRIDSGTIDGKVQTSKISTLKTLDLTQNNISDLTGIQDFVSLTNLYCGKNSLKALNVSKNTALTVLDCNNNQITALDVSNNVALTTLYCGQNSLTTLNVSKNKALTTLDCNNNKINSLDVSNNIALLDLTCYTNQLTSLDVKVNTALTKLNSGANQYTSLDVSSNTALTFLGCNTSQLTSIDVSKNTALTLLDCRENKITSLDVSKLTALTELYCQSNQLKDLDVSKNKSLELINCSKNQLTTLDISVHPAAIGLYANSNQLTSLNLKNGNNSNFQLLYLNLTNNPNLSCIQVDDKAYSDANWSTKKDATSSYETNCTSYYTEISDSNFEQKLINLGIDTDGLNGKITTANISSITSLDLSNSNIKDLTGIENFTALNILDCRNNQLTTIDLSKNSNLQILYVTGNPLVYLNLKNGNNQNLIVESQSSKKAANIPGTSFLGLINLGCVKVDSAPYSNANWSRIKEVTTTYSETCTLGLEDSVFDKVVIYPNPTTGEVNINNASLEKATVYNSLGQLVKTFNLDSSNTINTINLTGLPKGIYYIYLINQDAASAKKVIVE